MIFLRWILVSLWDVRVVLRAPLRDSMILRQKVKAFCLPFPNASSQAVCVRGSGGNSRTVRGVRTLFLWGLRHIWYWFCSFVFLLHDTILEAGLPLSSWDQLGLFMRSHHDWACHSEKEVVRRVVGPSLCLLAMRPSHWCAILPKLHWSHGIWTD